MNFLEGINILGDIITGNNKKSHRNIRNENENSVYNSNRLKQGIKRQNDKASKRKSLSRDPVKTGIISKNIRKLN